MEPIRVGYYFSRIQNSSIAVRYINDKFDDVELEFFFDDLRTIAIWSSGSCTFEVKIKQKRWKYTYTNVDGEREISKVSIPV